MMSTMQLPRHLRRAVPVIVIVLGLLLITAVMIQQVVAQDSSGLKPPFRLIQPAHLSAPLSGVPPLPLSAPIIMSETFDSNFALNTRYNFDVSNTNAPWHLVNASGIVDTSYTWGRITGSPMTNTLWNAATNPPGKLPITAGQPYTKNMQAYAIYGPINMLDYTSAFISMTYKLDTLDGDLFGVAFSTNGTDFTWVAAASGRDPALTNLHTDYYPLPASVAYQRQVWIALVFTSQNRDNIDARGVFVDDVVLRANPAIKIFFPIVRLDPTPTPTMTPSPTATPIVQNYRYFFTFTNESSTNNPDFNRWGGDRSTSCGTNCTYYQALVGQYGNPSPAFDLWLQGVNGKGGSGPRANDASLTTATNFEYSADLYVYNGQLDARYGLVFDASSSTFPDSGNPPMSTSYNYYLLELRMDTSNRTKVYGWQFARVVNGGRSAVTSAASLPVAVNQGEWHNVKVVQQGTTMTFYLDGTYIGQGSYDSGWGDGRRRFGLSIDVRDTNGTGGPFEYFADNIIVRDR